MSKRQSSKPAGTKPAKPRSWRRITSFDDAVTVARTVTMDTFADALAAANADHGVTHVTRNVCRFTGRRIQHVQNDTFINNAKPEWQLSDVGLLFVWCVCFPMATGMVFAPNRPGTVPLMSSVHIVNGARRSFNAGKHGNVTVPATPSVRYGKPAATPAATPTPTNVADAKLARRR